MPVAARLWPHREKDRAPEHPVQGWAMENRRLFPDEHSAAAARANRPVSEMALMVVTRLAALVALSLAVLLAARLIGLGVAGFAPMRFDAIAPGPRSVLVCTAVCCAAAGLGLWSLARWGAILWSAALAALIYMHVLEGEVYGRGAGLYSVMTCIVLVHASVFVWNWAARRTRLSLR
jgi:hypothetical protein